MQPLKPAFVRCLCYRKPGGSRTTRASVSWRSFAAVEDSFLQRSFEWRLCLSQKSQNCVTKNKTTKKIELSSLVTQWVKDLVLLLLWLWLLQWCEFSHWPGNFHMPWAWSKKKKKYSQVRELTHGCSSYSGCSSRLTPTKRGTRHLFVLLLEWAFYFLSNVCDFQNSLIYAQYFYNRRVGLTPFCR